MAETRTLDVDGGRIVLSVSGDGPAVVLSHAIGPVGWGDLDELSRSCTVVVPRWIDSSLDADSRASLQWLRAVAETVGQERVALAVWSMSGPAAIEYAAGDPAELSRLILVDVAGLGPGLPELSLKGVLHVIAGRILGHPTRGFVRMLWNSWVRSAAVDTRPLEEATYRFLKKEPDSVGPPDDDDEGDDPLELLGSVTIPTLVLAGRHSTVMGPTAGKAAVERLTEGKLIVFDDSSHALQLEEPTRFQQVVAGFVAGGGA